MTEQFDTRLQEAVEDYERLTPALAVMSLHRAVQALLVAIQEVIKQMPAQYRSKAAHDIGAIITAMPLDGDHRTIN